MDRTDGIEAYQLIAELARPIEETQQTQLKLEVQYASSDLCESIDPASSPSTNH